MVIYNNLLFFCIYRNPYSGGAGTCITYDAINAAYVDARKRIRKWQLSNFGLTLPLHCINILYYSIDVAQPKSDWKPEELATVGELLLDISIQLART